MLTVVGIKFRQAGKIYYFNPMGFDLKLNDKVVVENARGLEIGIVGEEKKDIDEKEFSEELMPIVRLANKTDLENEEKNKKKEEEALVKAKELVDKFNLQMKLVNAEYTLDGSKVIINFTCEDRVDFRELVKELATYLKVRIELRQIGIRDQAKIVGAIGNCGKECCCKQYLSDFDKVCIKMAKTQNLSLNPTKISGVCGRLMCCLAYENEFYSEVVSRMPKINSKVRTKDGVGNVIYNDILKERVVVKYITEDNVKVENYALSEITVLAPQPQQQNNNNRNNNGNNHNKNNADNQTKENKSQKEDKK